VTGAELIADIINWNWYLLTLLVHGLAPGLLLRVIVLAFEKGDPRRQELIAELYAVPFIKRPYWVAQQLETALSDGIWPRLMWMLTGRVIYRWKLGDGEKRNRNHPKTTVRRWGLEARLENVPFLFPRLECGDTVKFKGKHVIDIDTDDGDEHPILEAA
jgi:hypothetical protein